MSDTTTFGCGDQTWPNLDVLIADAASARYNREAFRSYRTVLLALALDNPGLEVSQRTMALVEQGYDLQTVEPSNAYTYKLFAVKQ